MAEIKAVFAQMDEDGDGVVDIEEFKRAMERHHKKVGKIAGTILIWQGGGQDSRCMDNMESKTPNAASSSVHFQ